MHIGRILTFFASLLLMACSNGEMRDPRSTAQVISAGVGEVKISKPGSRGAFIFVLEEYHSSRLAQLQEAVMLERLRDKHGLKEIGLEGFLREDKESAAIPLRSGTRLQPSKAIDMLEKGQISSAEFMRLTQGTMVHAIEKAEEYFYPDEQASASPFVFLLSIAQKKLIEDLERNALDTQMRKRLENLESELDRASDEERDRKIQEFQRSLIEWDPWTKQAFHRLSARCGDEILSLQEQLALLESIKARASKVGAKIDPIFRQGLEEYIRFLEAREASSKTMADQVSRIADASSTCVAMVIGAAHTERVVDLLSEQNRPFAVMTPLAMVNCEDTFDMPMEEYSRLIQGLPLKEGVLEKALLRAYPVKIRPKPVSRQDWFKARTELIDLIDSFVRETLSGSGGGKEPPYPPKVPLLAFDDPDRWRGGFVEIDSKRANLAVNDESGELAVVFPVLINPRTPSKTQEVWIRASLVSTEREALVGKHAESAKPIEDLLVHAIERIRSASRGKKPKLEPRKGLAEKRVKDLTRVIEIATDVKAFVGISKEEVMKGWSPI